MADKVSGLFMAQAILAALFHRQRTGEGQFVEVPMLECVTSFTLAEHLFGHVYDPPTGPWAYTRVANPQRKPFPTKDGYIGLLPYTDQQWDQFFAAAGLADTFGKDPRFADYKTRARHVRELYALVDEVTPTHTTAEWLALLKPLNIPVVRTNRLDELPGRPASGRRRSFRALPTPRGRRVHQPALAARVLRDPRRHPPPSPTARRAHGGGFG